MHIRAPYYIHMYIVTALFYVPNVLYTCLVQLWTRTRTQGTSGGRDFLHTSTSTWAPFLLFY